MCISSSYVICNITFKHKNVKFALEMLLNSWVSPKGQRATITWLHKLNPGATKGGDHVHTAGTLPSIC